MESNASEFKSNVTLDQVIDYFNINITSLNQSEVTQTHLIDLYEAYRTIGREQLMVYKSVAYILGTLIILSNLTVVISSGLILRKGQQPKSTYLLLGNVSLADTIIGFSIIFGVMVDNSASSNPLCIFQIGMLVCPAMVSIFSVGLIAVDRYIYILHGLYYQRWFNTTRVRIGILFIWIISVILGFMPATGWSNTEPIPMRCYYVTLFPGPLILLNSLLSIVPIIVVCVLYSIILVKALKTVRNLRTGAKSLRRHVMANDKLKLRIDCGTVHDKRISTQTIKIPKKPDKLFRSVSFNIGDNNVTASKLAQSNSINDITNSNTDANNINSNIDNRTSKFPYDSRSSVYTVESNITDRNSSNGDLENSRTSPQISKPQNNAASRKIKEPNKWRAITIVMLTSGSFIFTWTPFIVTVIFFVFCEDQLTNPRCRHYRTLLSGVLPKLTFLNSILNPLIYAWWHKGFRKSVRLYYHKYIRKYNCRART